MLIAVANCPETYKPQLAEGSGRTQTVRMILIVNSTTAVTLKIDPSVVLATRKYGDDALIEVKAYADSVMKSHTDAKNPHSQYLQVANALAEIKDAGLVADVLKNLGLGDVAKKSVGNGAGQVPDMNFFAAVKSGNGYTQLPNGVILQWGSGGFKQKSSTTVVLPIEFPNAGVAVIACKGSSLPLTGEYGVGAGFRNKASFDLTNTGPDTTVQGITWLALGY